MTDATSRYMTKTQNGELRWELRRIGRRLRWLRAWSFVPAGITIGFLWATIWLASNHLEARQRPGTLLIFCLVLAPFSIAIVAGFILPLSDLQIARLTETRAHLMECISTALYMETEQAHPFAGLISRTAIDKLKALDTASVFPVRLHRSLWFAAGTAVVAALMFNLPSRKSSPQGIRDVNEMASRYQQVMNAANLVADAERKLNMPGAGNAANQLRKLATAMQNRTVAPDIALIKQHDISNQLQRLISQAEAARDTSSNATASAAALKWAAKFTNVSGGVSPPSNSLQLTQAGKQSSLAAQAVRSLSNALKQNDERAILQSLQQLARTADEVPARSTARRQITGLLNAVEESLQSHKQVAAAAKIADLANEINTKTAINTANNSVRSAALQAAAKAAANALTGRTASSMAAQSGLKDLQTAQQQIDHGYAQGTTPGHTPKGGVGYTRGGQIKKWMRASMPDHSVAHELPTSSSPKQTLTTGVAPRAHDAGHVGATAGKRTANARVGGSATSNAGQITEVQREAPGARLAPSPLYRIDPATMSSAESALRQHDVPPSMRAQVRNYFSLLQHK